MVFTFCSAVTNLKITTSLMTLTIGLLCESFVQQKKKADISLQSVYYSSRYRGIERFLEFVKLSEVSVPYVWFLMNSEGKQTRLGKYG